MAAVMCALPVNERFYKFGTPSPSSSSTTQEYNRYSELEDSDFHSDDEIQKVSFERSVIVYVFLCTMNMPLATGIDL